MAGSDWRTIRERQVAKYVLALDDVARARVEADIGRLEKFGPEATAPLVKTYRGKVRYLRTKASRVHRRIFFFVEEPGVFRLFYATDKRTRVLSRKTKREIAAAYEASTGSKI